MNMAVDYNKLRFLILLVVLAGEISFEMRDMHRGFYFYNQAVRSPLSVENRLHLCRPRFY